MFWIVSQSRSLLKYVEDSDVARFHPLQDASTGRPRKRWSCFRFQKVDVLSCLADERGSDVAHVRKTFLVGVVRCVKMLRPLKSQASCSMWFPVGFIALDDNSLEAYKGLLGRRIRMGFVRQSRERALPLLKLHSGLRSDRTLRAKSCATRCHL